MNYDLAQLEKKTAQELYALAKELKVEGYSRLKKRELIFEILKAETEKDGFLFAHGILDVLGDGFGFLRPINYLPSSEDIYVSPSQIRRFDLKTGDQVYGKVRHPRTTRNLCAAACGVGQRFSAFRRHQPHRFRCPHAHLSQRTHRLGQQADRAEHAFDGHGGSGGQGQRGLIVSPPKAARLPCSNRSVTPSPPTILKST